MQCSVYHIIAKCAMVHLKSFLKYFLLFVSSGKAIIDLLKFTLQMCTVLFPLCFFLLKL